MSETDELPNGWELVELNDVSTITSSKRIFQDEYVSNGIPFYRTKEVKELSEGKSITNNLFISDEKYNEIKSRFAIPQKGDVLLSAVGTIGISYVIKNDNPFYFKDGNLMWFKDLNYISSYFLSYGLTNFIRNGTGAKTSGSAYNALTIETMSRFLFPIPPLPEQHRIVSKIEELFSSLDKGVESLKTARKQLKVYRQSVLKWAFEGKLTNCYSIEWIKLGALCENVEYGSATKSKDSGTTPVLRMGNIQNGVFDWDDLVYTSDEVEIKKYLLQKGDVLFNRTNSPEWVGKTAIYKGERPAIFAGYLIRINYLKDKLNPSYLNYFLNSQTAKNHGNSVKSFGVNQSNINGTKLKEYPFPICSLAEQQAIVSEIESRLSVCDKIEESITQSLLQAEALRQSILKKAFEGKLVPQDPSDEPASVLLERIKAEREKNIVAPKAKKVKKSRQTEITFETV